MTEKYRQLFQSDLILEQFIKKYKTAFEESLNKRVTTSKYLKKYLDK